MNIVKWGIIGCGEVAEKKSGPAFQKVEHSELVAVMRRNTAKAQDFAKRHAVPFFYDTAEELLKHKDINAIYIATPPSSHLRYALKALKAGKNVYLEKPMALTFREAQRISDAVKRSSSKLTVAHYRRMLPAFRKVKELLVQNAIGKVIFADIQILQSRNSTIIAHTDDNWRLNPEVSGGGYFYDLAPHQLDLMYWYFGSFDKIVGFSNSNSGDKLVEDTVNGIISFDNGVHFRGVWNFSSSEENQKEECAIYGTEGSIRFSFYGETVRMETKKGECVFDFRNPKHVQQPMIAAVTDYFMGKRDNPCTAEEGVDIMLALEKLSGRIK